MAAAHIARPYSLGTSHRSCNPGGGEWRNDSSSLRFALKRSRRHVSRWSARLEFRGSSGGEDASSLMEMTTLVDDLFHLKAFVKEANRGIGAEVRNRVDVLYNRATLLKYSADNMVSAGGRVPVQLTATLKGLQREQASVENIVRLVMETTDVEEPAPSKGVSFFSSEVMLQEKDPSQASLFESLALESSLKPTEELYAMTAPAADDLSPLAAFRREMGRRVMEQLASEKELDGLREGDGNNLVLEPIPVTNM